MDVIRRRQQCRQGLKRGSFNPTFGSVLVSASNCVQTTIVVEGGHWMELFKRPRDANVTANREIFIFFPHDRLGMIISNMVAQAHRGISGMSIMSSDSYDIWTLGAYLRPRPMLAERGRPQVLCPTSSNIPTARPARPSCR